MILNGLFAWIVLLISGIGLAVCFIPMEYATASVVVVVLGILGIGTLVAICNPVPK